MTARSLSLCMAIFAFAAASAEAESWTNASGDVAMTYRATAGGSLFGRNASNIDQTVATDVISTLEVGGTSGPSDDDPGTLNVSSAGSSEVPRSLGEVDVNAGTLSITSSIFDTTADGINRDLRVTGPTAELEIRLSETRNGTDIIVRDGGSVLAEASQISVNAADGAVVRASGIAGGVSSDPTTDIVIDASTLGTTTFRGAFTLRNSSVDSPGPTNGSCREGLIQLESVVMDLGGGLGVGNNVASTATTADSDVIWTSTQVESGRGSVGANGVFSTYFEMRGASLWHSSADFGVGNPLTVMDVNSGSRVDVAGDFLIASGSLTVSSGTPGDARIDVAGDFDLGPAAAATLTIEDGGYVDVDGTFTLGAFGTLNLNGGTLRVGNFVDEAGGTFNENGGTLIVPEASGVAVPIAAALALALLRRRRD